MADDADRTGERMQMEAEVGLAHVRHQITQQAAALPAVGACYNCGAELGGGLRWCDADCRDDWQKRGRQ